MSNTKICKISKLILVNFKANNPNAVFFDNGEGVTVLEMREFPGSKMKMVSVAFASEDEIKIRRKVGEYKAMEKFENGEFIKVPHYVDILYCL